MSPHWLLLAALVVQAQDPPARLTRVEGEVAVKDARGRSVPARPGMPVAAGAVETGADSSATLEFADGTQVDLGAGTTLALARPKPVRGLRLTARDGTTQELSPGVRLLLAWPKAGDPAAAREGGPDFTLLLEEPLSCAAPAPPPAAQEPVLPPSEAEEAPPPPSEEALLEIEIVGDAPPRVTRRPVKR